jgi:hypothetical protein
VKIPRLGDDEVTAIATIRAAGFFMRGTAMIPGCSGHHFRRITIMQNETGNNMGGINDTGTLEAEVRSAVEQDHDVQEMVRQLTLRRISARSLDIESLRQITRAVLSGARAGTQKELQ